MPERFVGMYVLKTFESLASKVFICRLKLNEPTHGIKQVVSALLYN
jgi:hypothetical protein